MSVRTPYVGNYKAAYSTGTTSLSTAAITTASSGSTFVIVSHSGNQTNTHSDSKSNSYTTPTYLENTAGGNRQTYSYSQNGTGGASHTATCGLGASTDCALYFIELRDVATSSYDGSSETRTQDNTAPFTASTNTLAQAVSIVLASMTANPVASVNNYVDWANKFIESTGFTVLMEQDQAQAISTGCVAYKVVNSTAACSCSLYSNFDDSGCIIMVAFKGLDDSCQRAVPTSDISGTNWSKSTGSTFYGLVDEFPPDHTDYAYTNTASAVVEVKYASVTDPASSSGYRVKFGITGDGTSGATVRLRQSTGTTIASKTIDPVPKGFSIQYIELTGAEADHVTDHADLRIDVTEV